MEDKTMGTETNIAKSASSTSSTKPSTPALSLTLGFVGLQRTSIEHMGETRTRDRHAARVAPIRVRSVAAGDAFVPLASPIQLETSVAVVEATFRPVTKGEIVLPKEKSTDGVDTSAPTLEFTFDRIPVFGLVKSRDSQLMLVAADVDDETQLPPDFELVGVLSAPVGTHSLHV
jgi:hypothetical protein